MAYAVRADIPRFGISADAIADVTTGDQDGALSSSSGFMNGFIRAAYKLPLSSWEDDVRECCCVLAVETMMFARGMAPGGVGGDDQRIVDRADRWRSWLSKVSSGLVVLEVGEASPGPLYAPLVESDCSRGQ